MSGNDLAHPRIGILVVAYNAESTLRATLDRIPADFRERIAEVIVLDDASHDDTFARGQDWARRPDTPRTLVVRHTKNLGYGGNQKGRSAPGGSPRCGGCWTASAKATGPMRSRWTMRRSRWLITARTGGRRTLRC